MNEITKRGADVQVGDVVRPRANGFTYRVARIDSESTPNVVTGPSRIARDDSGAQYQIADAARVWVVVPDVEPDMTGQQTTPTFQAGDRVLDPTTGRRGVVTVGEWPSVVDGSGQVGVTWDDRTVWQREQVASLTADVRAPRFAL